MAPIHWNARRDEKRIRETVGANDYSPVQERNIRPYSIARIAGAKYFLLRTQILYLFPYGRFCVIAPNPHLTSDFPEVSFVDGHVPACTIAGSGRGRATARTGQYWIRTGASGGCTAPEFEFKCVCGNGRGQAAAPTPFDIVIRISYPAPMTDPKETAHERHRRSIRLRGYDYSGNGAYFVMICTHNREHLFGEIENGEM